MAVTPSRRVAGRRLGIPIEGLERRTLLSTVVVNTTADSTDAPGSPTISLRDAVATADAAASPTTIAFSASVFATAQKIVLTGTTLELSNRQEAITIQGPSAGVTIDGGGQSVVFTIDAGVTTTITGVTVTNASGGAIYNNGVLTLTNSTVSNSSASTLNSPHGGGLDNFGAATVTGDTFTGNTACFGGGVVDEGTIVVTDSTFNNNTAIGYTGTYAAAGAGLYVAGTATVTNDTFIGNDGTTGNGLSVSLTGMLTLSDSTVANNGEGGGIENDGNASDFTIANTIVAGNGNGGNDATGAFNSHGYNLVGAVGTSTGWVAADLTGTVADPLSPDLGNLANNGGVTETLLPRDGSPVLNAGSIAFVPIGITTDQRGDPREVNGTVDIGSVETTKLVAVTPPADQTAVPLVATSIDLGSFTAAGTDGPYTITIAWGDGTVDNSETIIDEGEIAPLSHTFPTAATDTVTLTVSDVTGDFTGTASFTVTVAPVPALTVTPPAAQSALIDTSTSFALGSFAETNTTGPYAVTVNWGDNTTPTTFSAAAAGALPATAHAFVTSGAETVTVTVANSTGTLTASTTFGVTVTTGSTATSASLVSSTDSTVYGDPVTLTATVSPAAATGVVTFLSDGTEIGQVAVTGGTATYTSTALAIGDDAVTAVYSGDHNYASSTAAAVQVKVAAPAVATTTTLASSTAATTTSQSVVLTATVAATDSTVDVGDVTFYEGTTVLGTAAVSTGGVATLTTTTGLAPGTDSLTATYAGNASFLTSTSAAVTITVTQTPTVTALTSSTTSETLSQSITLTATITPATVTASTLTAISPTGTVTFTQQGTVIGTATVGADGVAALTTTAALPLGVDAITASYGGDASFGGSTSAVLDLSVTAHALVPTIRAIDVPATAIGGVPVRGSSVGVTLTNELSTNEAGDESGYFAVAVYAAASTTLAPGDPVVASVLKTAHVHEGKSINVTVPITSLPASLAGGTYHLLVVTTDSFGNVEVADTGKTVAVTAPVVSLTAAFAALPKTAVKSGATVTLSDAGNAVETTTLTAVVGLSTDAAGTDVVATGVGTVRPTRVTLRPGGTTKVKVSGWASLVAAQPAGTYYLTITLTDAAGHTATATSVQTV